MRTALTRQWEWTFRQSDLKGGVARYRGSDLTTTETTVVKMSATAARNHRSDVNECYGTELQQIARDLVPGSRKGSQ